MAEIIEYVSCPMLCGLEIETGYCDELQMIADDAITPTEAERSLSQKEFDICKRCKKRFNPAD